MPQRAWVLAVLVLSTSASTLRAHGVSVLCEVAAPDRVVVFAYLGTAPAGGAALRVSDANGAEILTGSLDGAGRYVFAPTEAIPYAFEVTIAGHRAQCQLSPSQVAQLEIGTATRQHPGPAPQITAAAGGPDQHLDRSAAPHHQHDVEHTGDPPIVELVAGLALILALAAVVMNAFLGRQLRAHLDQHKPTKG